MWGLIYVGAFLVTFAASAVLKVTWHPLGDKYSVRWDDSVGTVYTDPVSYTHLDVYKRQSLHFRIYQLWSGNQSYNLAGRLAAPNKFFIQKRLHLFQ